MMRPKRENACWPMVFDGGFRFRAADAETDGKCHRGQARRARQEPDALRLKREITVFPALHKPTLRTTNAPTLMRESGESVGFMEQSGINHTVSPLGREADQSGRPRKIWKTWSGTGGTTVT